MAHTANLSFTPITIGSSLMLEELDPGFLMRDAFTIGLDKNIATSDILLAWMMRIPDHTSPADAARFILDNYVTDRQQPIAANLEKLITLLKELSFYTPEKLKKLKRSRRSRRNSEESQPNQHLH